MIDSVLNGTGNSRFLKSAVPAGTSWADALAMLQAGTFPIDFNGINTDGFQQVGTPLNKANLLKDATAAQIGLPPSTTPDGMFQALGNTGELHVWRKTVVNASEKPAGYTLGIGDKTTLIIKSLYGSGTQYANVEYGNACAVYDNGEAYIPNSTTTSKFIVTDSSTLAILNNTLKGKFCKFHAVSGSNRLTVLDGVFFIPSNATFQNEIPTSGDTKITVDVAQKVNAYPLTPAGTTTTYPVSTNPNAYQEGDDAKAAGYTLGEVVTGSFKLGINAASDAYMWKASSALTVTDTGVPSLSNPTDGRTGSGGDLYSESVIKSFMAGKFVQYVKRVSDTISPPDDFPPFNATPSSIVYVPSDVVVSYSNENYIIDRYQPVTGYAAIPAGTTIEYLGKLGDKARVQVVSYVGTGTYGSDHPNSLTFDFVPKFFAIMGDDEYYSRNAFAIRGANYMGYQFDGNTRAVYITWEEAKFSWYSYINASRQYNESGKTYYAIAIG